MKVILGVWYAPFYCLASSVAQDRNFQETLQHLSFPRLEYFQTEFGGRYPLSLLASKANRFRQA